MCDESPSFVFSLHTHEIQMNVFQKVYFCFTFFCHHLQVPSPPQPVEEISSSTDLISINLSGRKFFILLRNFARCFFCAHYILYLHVYFIDTSPQVPTFQARANGKIRLFVISMAIIDLRPPPNRSHLTEILPASRYRPLQFRLEDVIHLMPQNFRPIKNNALTKMTNKSKGFFGSVAIHYVQGCIFLIRDVWPIPSYPNVAKCLFLSLSSKPK